MASGTKMAYNNHYQNGRYGNISHPPHTEIDFTEDMHLKMSKKIAQLTKVIYALNTKNDESETVLQALRDQHEEEIQKIISETRQKLDLYKQRLDESLSLNQNVDTLQKHLSLQQEQHNQLIDTFTQYKAEVQKDKSGYADKISDMSHELLQAKHDFEEQMKRYATWQDRVNLEHKTEIAELKSKHQSEIENVHDMHRNSNDTWKNEYTAIEDKFKSQMDGLNSTIDKLEKEKSELKEEFDMKMEKAQDFFEKEMEAMKQQQLQDTNSEKDLLKKEIEKMRSDYSANDKEMRQQIDRLVRQLADTEDNLEQSQKHTKSLEEQLLNGDSKSKEIVEQLHALKEELSSKSSSLHSLELELIASKQHCSDLDDELKKKSGLVGELEAHKMQRDQQLSALQSELDALKAKLAHLEKQRSDEKAQQNSYSSEVSSQLHSLQQALEDVTIEKETLQQRLEKQIQSLKDMMAQKEKELVDKTQELSRMEEVHKIERDRDRSLAAETLVKAKEDLIEQHKVELSKAEKEKENLQSELTKIRDDLTAQLSAAEEEVKRLQAHVKEREAGLGSVSSQVTRLNEVISQLQAELERTKVELKTSKAHAASLQAEIDKLKMLNESDKKQMETTLRERLEKLTKELDAKWTETMISESSKLRQEITLQKEEEKRSALAALSKLKEEEIKANRAGLDAKINHLTAKIEELTARLSDSSSNLESEKLKWEQQLEREKSQLNKSMLEAATDYSDKIAALERIHSAEIEKLTSQKEQEKQTLENELNHKHLEEIQGQMTAHKASIEHTKQLEQRQREQELSQLKEQHQEELAKTSERLETDKQQALEELKWKHQMEMQAARMELERAVQISKQKDQDHQMQLEEMKTEIGHREQHIKNLQDQLSKLQAEINKLKKELEAKGMEIKQVQKHAIQKLKAQEDKLSKEYQEVIDNISLQHRKEEQEILAQFNNAQDILKDKISALQIGLEEAEMKYNQRDSRPEDLELIESLRCEVSERENRIKDLIDEKRFYQLELVNRETNFNKVFNTNPNVGVLDPFQKPRKKGDKGGKLPSLTNGLSSSHQKLEPLPGSPLHDGKLNPSKPLPQPQFAKKFFR